MVIAHFLFSFPERKGTQLSENEFLKNYSKKKKTNSPLDISSIILVLINFHHITDVNCRIVIRG
jgi:hypothetical protein